MTKTSEAKKAKESGATSFAYDAFGRVTQTTFPSNSFETYAYDAVGNLPGKTDRKSQTIQYVYDALNRLTRITPPSNPRPFSGFWNEDFPAFFTVRLPAKPFLKTPLPARSRNGLAPLKPPPTPTRKRGRERFGGLTL